MKHKVTNSLFAGVVLGAIVSTSPVRAGDIQTDDVLTWDGSTVVGESTLVRTPSGVTMTVETSGIPDGHAVTIWWVVFNNPGECATAPCGENDLFVDAVQADVLYAAGHVVGNSGQANFAAHLNEGDRSGSIAGLFDLPDPQGLADAETAEIHNVVRSHGPKARGRTLKAQIHTFEGGCEVDLPPGTIPVNFGECADIQFSIHQ